MKRARIVIAVVLSVLPAAVWLAASSPAPAAERGVRIVTGNRFDPQDKFIVAGDTVVWTYDDANGVPHTVTRQTSPERFDSSPSNCPDATPLAPPADDCIDSNNRTYSHRFDRPGTYAYFCKVHGQSMSGTIHVAPRETATPTPRRTTAKPSPSPSASESGTASPDPSASPSGSPGGTPAPDGSPTPAPTETPLPPPSSGGNGAKLALAAVALGSLGGAGFFIYRRFLA